MEVLIDDDLSQVNTKTKVSVEICIQTVKSNITIILSCSAHTKGVCLSADECTQETLIYKAAKIKIV